MTGNLHIMVSPPLLMRCKSVSDVESGIDPFLALTLSWNKLWSSRCYLLRLSPNLWATALWRRFEQALYNATSLVFQPFLDFRCERSVKRSRTAFDFYNGCNNRIGDKNNSFTVSHSVKLVSWYATLCNPIKKWNNKSAMIHCKRSK